MTIDLLGSIDLTASAAVLIAVLAIAFGENGLARARIAGGLGAWFVLVTVLASTGAFNYPDGLGAPGLGLAVAVPMIVLTVGVIRSPRLRRVLHGIPLPVLIGVHVIRILGVLFLILWGLGRLSAPFAPAAGWGDVFAGIAAAPVAWLVYRRGASVRSVVWIWNTFGFLDLVSAIGLGVISAPGPTQLLLAAPGTAIMTSLPWLLIPAFLVPLLASIHVGLFYRMGSATPMMAKGWAGT
ncbi:MAG: hypothetical protein ACYDDO_13275 [Acidiferrobacterales bacterium]